MAKEQRQHRFWEMQPVGAMKPETPEEAGVVSDPAVVIRSICVKKEIDAVHSLLYKNYVEDAESMFRLAYSKDFLIWQLQVPGTPKEWNVGMFRNGELVGFISASALRVAGKDGPAEAVSINFLCISKEHRRKGWAPLLIREITRRVNASGVYRALFTTSEKLPFLAFSVNYRHRIINGEGLPRKQFCTVRDLISTPSIPESPVRLRRARVHEMPLVRQMYAAKYKRLDVSVIFTPEQFEHCMRPREGLMECLVTEEVSEFVSFFFLETEVITDEKEKEKEEPIKIAYLYYHSCKNLRDALCSLMEYLQKETDCCVLNALPVEENDKGLLTELGFLEGDGILNYYFYNWKHHGLSPQSTGFITL